MAKAGKPILGLGDDFSGFWDLLEPQLEKTGKSVANKINAETTVTMKRDDNGRPVAMVTIAEAKGLALQAKHGTLTKAAAQEGLDIHRYQIER